MPLLTADQKKALAALAREAYGVQKAQGSTVGIDADQFRQTAVQIATKGRAFGLTSADRNDYPAIRTELLLLAGRDAEAFVNAKEEPDQMRNQILWCIRHNAARVILGGQTVWRKDWKGWETLITDDVSARMEAYISKIVADRFDAGENWRDDLTENQLIDLSKTLAARAAAKRHKAAAKAAPISAE